MMPAIWRCGRLLLGKAFPHLSPGPCIDSPLSRMALKLSDVTALEPSSEAMQPPRRRSGDAQPEMKAAGGESPRSGLAAASRKPFRPSHHMYESASLSDLGLGGLPTRPDGRTGLDRFWPLAFRRVITGDLASVYLHAVE